MRLDRGEIETLYQRYGHVVYHRCLSFLQNEEEASDAMQEVFLRLLRSADQLRGEASPMTWLYRTSTNFCLNRIRDRKARARKLAEPAREADLVPGMGAFAGMDPERRELVRALLERVDPETQSIVIYYFVDEMTLKEIAEVVEMSVPTLRKRIRRFQGLARKTMGLGPVVVGGLLIILQLMASSSGVRAEGAAVWPSHIGPTGLETLKLDSERQL